MDEMTIRRTIRSAGFNTESLRQRQRGDGAETIVRTIGPEADRFRAWVDATPEVVIVRWTRVERSGGRTTTAFYVRSA